MKDKMKRLHELMVDLYIEKLENPKDLTAAEQENIRKFLSGNDVTLLGILRDAGADISGAGAVGPRLLDNMPYPDPEEGPMDGTNCT